MKLIATNKFNRALPFISNLKKYRETLIELESKLLEDVGQEPIALCQERKEIKKTSLVVITSDRGLCGSFNYYIQKASLSFLSGKDGDKMNLECFGRKGFDFFTNRQKKVSDNQLSSINKRKWPLAGDDSSKPMLENFPDDMPSDNLARVSARDLIASFKKGQTDEIYLCYNFFHSTISQKPIIEKWLPFKREEEKKSQEPNKTTSSIDNHLFEPNKQELLEEIVEMLLFQKFYFALFSSLAGEHAARMSAMENASQNCGDLIDKYTLERNRARQAAITTELIEIISGSSSV